MFSCISPSRVVEEGEIYKTRIYAGLYTESIHIDEKFTVVFTTYGYFKLKENPEIPDSSLCYIKREYPSYYFHPDIERQMIINYFTWNGADKEYRIYNKLKLKR